MSPLTRPPLFTVFALLLVARCARTFPAPGTEAADEDSSAEDSNSSFDAQLDESASALKTDDSSSVEDSELKSSELSTEGPWVDDNPPKKIDLSLSDESQKQNSLDLLQQVYDNAGQFSNKLDKVVGVANNKITDWTQRINNYRSFIFGTGNNNNQYNGGGDQWNNYGGGGGGGYGSNYQNSVSITSAYHTIKPFIIEIRDVLLKVFAFTSKLASRFFVSIPVRATEPTMVRPGMAHAVSPHHVERFEPSRAGGRVRTQPKGRKTRNQYTKGKGRRKARVGVVGRRRAKSTQSEQFETQPHVETLAYGTEIPAYAANDAVPLSNMNNPDAAPNYQDY